MPPRPRTPTTLTLRVVVCCRVSPAPLSRGCVPPWSQEIDPALLQLLVADSHANSLGGDAGRTLDGRKPQRKGRKLGAGVEAGSLGGRLTQARRSIAHVFSGGARAQLIRAANEVAGELDTMQVLELDSMQLVPLAHLGIVKAILSNLRTAGFEANESNVLLRALYSYNDELNGDGLREKVPARPRPREPLGHVGVPMRRLRPRVGRRGS